MPIYAEKTGLGGIFDFRDSKKAPFGPPFYSKIDLGRAAFPRGPFSDRPWRDPLPKMVPGRPRPDLSSILDRCSMDFGLILSDCWPHFDTP